MSRHGARRGAAVALATAAAVLLAGCGSGDDGGGEHAGRPGASPSASAPRDGERSDTPQDGKGPDAGGVPSGPKVPDDQLDAAERSFTTKEKKYLSGRVPKGHDPAAVLEGGQEACDRLRFLNELDPEMAVSALILGEITNARAAVSDLCPTYRSTVEAADRGHTDGEFTVGAERKAGTTVVPGRYRSPGPGPSGPSGEDGGGGEECSWQVTGAGGKPLDSGSGRAKGGDIDITIPKAARGFTSTGCHSWLRLGGTG
ncbi:hypothetical protein [Streptomyces zingiberis]|uniref:DUF732 domain-containing protein n=1 Tax=Streptomyces zingiberis TaxID=2053010 RepID=A0ABX1BV80_9ACTN|nr:hypothetical protein [Streptomyces zingiberis]NJP99661.1 hypothetical protein [Streptomyces zingiberis]